MTSRIIFTHIVYYTSNGSHCKMKMLQVFTKSKLLSFIYGISLAVEKLQISINSTNLSTKGACLVPVDVLIRHTEKLLSQCQNSGRNGTNKPLAIQV